MHDRDAHRLHRKIEQIARSVPSPVARVIRWLKGDASRLSRILIALLFIAGGLLGFLPVLGFWMVPIGLLVLAIDVPALRRPLLNVIVGVQRWWRNRRFARERRGAGG